MISEAEFNQIQNILADKGNPRPQTVKLPYRGLIYCGECGCSVCMEEKHQTICSKCKTKFASKNRTECIKCKTPISEMHEPTRLHYIYGHCTKKKKSAKCTQKSIKINDLEQQLKEFLSSIKIGPKTEQWVLKQLAKVSESELNTKSQIRKNLQTNLDAVQAELDSLLKQFSSPKNLNYELIEPDEYKVSKAKLKKNRERAEKLLADNLKQTDTFSSDIENKFKLAVRARSEFESGNFEKQTEIIRDLGSNLILKDGIITIQQDYPWLFIKKANAKLAELKDKGLEPEKSIDIYEQTGVPNEVIFTLQG